MAGYPGIPTELKIYLKHFNIWHMTTFELGACGIAWAIASIPLTQILDNSLLNVRKQRDGVAEVVTLCPTNGLF